MTNEELIKELKARLVSGGFYFSTIKTPTVMLAIQRLKLAEEMAEALNHDLDDRDRGVADGESCLNPKAHKALTKWEECNG